MPDTFVTIATIHCGKPDDSVDILRVEGAKTPNRFGTAVSH
jgi:hypothetical protein